jgi:hypothetical protein
MGISRPFSAGVAVSVDQHRVAFRACDWLMQRWRGHLKIPVCALVRTVAILVYVYRSILLNPCNVPSIAVPKIIDSHPFANGAKDGALGRREEFSLTIKSLQFRSPSAGQLL